jgi:hypothetical protein
MNEEERQAGYELIDLLSEYQEDVRRLAVKLALSNIALGNNYDEVVEGSLLYRVYDKEIERQILMKGKNAANELLNLMKLTEEVSKKIKEDIEEG